MKSVDQTIDKDINLIYECVDSLMRYKDWKTLSKWFYGFLPQVDKMPLDIILAYVVSSAPSAIKIKYRRQFINKCKKIHKNKEIWVGL